ncbi:Hypothetical protein CINCED_3A005380 [Cinara cedri]|uniref:Uncharacterized protein n=1 Tax=Cinara cedri TaxID=506608 RepID=A0A5E4NJG2_9HEMI|nr:Hypothetical protein CINCED_3A005380 [Cinara cedri]
MYAQINADKLKMELSANREKQLKSVKNDKISKESSVKMDSGFCDMLSKENIEYDPAVVEKSEKETISIGIDSGLCIDESSIELVDDQNESNKQTKNDQQWKLYFKQNENGDTQLHLAIMHGFIKVSKWLIDICEDSKCLDIRNDDGQSALHLAVMTNQCEIVKYMLMKNANVELLDINGNNAVHLACYGGKLDCLKILASSVLLPKMLDTINYDGLACIHIATIANHLNILRFIVKRSINVNITDYKSGYTALHFAVALNRANLMECLLDKVDPNIESYAGKLAFEVGYDYDEDEEDDEISDDLVKSINEIQLPNNTAIVC